MHAPVGNENGACYAVVRDVRKRGRKRREQPRPVGLAIGLAGFDEPHFQAGHAPEAFCKRSPHLFGLPRAIAEFLARGLVDDDDGDRGQSIPVLAGD